MQKNKREKVVILGNCVAERLQGMLPRYPGFAAHFELVPAPVMHLMKNPEEWQSVAAAALGCDFIFTQPLFSYGPCNTEALRAALRGAQRLRVFSSPNFAAYFPDAIMLRDKVNMRLEPVFDWDSSIIFSCFLRGVPILEVESIYLNHPLFSEASMAGIIASGLKDYALREQGVDLGTGGHVLRHFAREKLFHSPRHPADALLRRMLEDMAQDLGLAAAGELPVDGFSFNQWAVITRNHGFFRFPEQAWFMVAGQRFSIEDVAMANYNFYEFNPHIVAANRDLAIEI